MRNQSKITTDLAVDAKLVQGPLFEFDHDDRQYLDNQIIGIEQHLVDALIRGRHATYFRLAGGSAAVVSGDNVCEVADVSVTEPTVTKANASSLANAKAATGVVIAGGAPGGYVLVAIGGLLPPTLTGLAATSGYVRVNTTTGRCERVASLSTSDFGIGFVSTSGWMQVAQLLVIATGVVVGDGNVQVVPYRSSAIDTSFDISTDYIVEFTATGKVGTLPNAALVVGKSYEMRAPAAGTSTANGNGNLIDGSATYTSVVQGENTVLRWNGTQWRKF